MGLGLVRHLLGEPRLEVTEQFDGGPMEAVQRSIVVAYTEALIPPLPLNACQYPT
jgi:hypothetical protein